MAKKHVNCAEDELWLMMLQGKDENMCNYEIKYGDRIPQLLYSPGSTAAVADERKLLVLQHRHS